MDNQALARSEALRRRASPRVDSRLGLESRMLSKQPVRFGRGRLDSLARKGLAAYLIICGRPLARLRRKRLVKHRPPGQGLLTR